VALMLPAIDVTWPEGLRRLAVNLDWLSLRWPFVWDLACSHPLTYFDRLEGTLIVLLPLLFAVPFWCALVHLCGVLCGAAPARLILLRARCTILYLVLIFALYAPVSKTVVRYFHCRSFYGEEVMMAEPTLACSSTDRDEWRGTAVAGVVLWIVGLPLSNSLLLCRLRLRRRLDHPYTRAAWGLLYRKYTADNYLFEAVEMLKKLVFTSLILLLEGDTQTQLTLFMLLAFFYLLLHAARRPFKEKHNDRIAFWAHVSIFLLLLLALLVDAGRSLPGPLVSSVPLLPLIVAGLLLVYVVLEKAGHKLRERRRKKAAEARRKLRTAGQAVAANIRLGGLAARLGKLGAASRKESKRSFKQRTTFTPAPPPAQTMAQPTRMVRELDRDGGGIRAGSVCGSKRSVRGSVLEAAPVADAAMVSAKV